MAIKQLTNLTSPCQDAAGPVLDRGHLDRVHCLTSLGITSLGVRFIFGGFEPVGSGFEPVGRGNDKSRASNCRAKLR